MINLIVAIGKDGAIGKGGDLIWKIPEDLKRFKALTTGHPVIMGRKTWESLPKKPLPGRRNIIITRSKDFQAEGAEIVNSIDEALKLQGNEDAFIIGGSEIYNAFLPLANRLYLTKINDTCPDANAFLEIDLTSDWKLMEESPKYSSASGVIYNFQTWERKVVPK